MLIHDNFQNYRRYNIPKAQLVIADMPYNIGLSAYASNPQWYSNGNMKNGKSKLAHKQFFDTDKNFNISEYFHFCNKLVKPEPKETNDAGCMIVFCSFEQQFGLIGVAKKHGFKNYINLVFYKNYSPQVLKANMRVVGNAEYALLLYRDKLPKFRNNGHMIFNCIQMERDTDTPKIHPTQKSKKLLKFLIRTFTDPGDVVIDPCAGSGVTLLAARQMNRRAYGFEIKREYVAAYEKHLMPLSANRELMFDDLQANKAKGYSNKRG